MKYMGSKARVAKDISPIINQIIKDNGITIYIEPFVGGANMIQHIKCPIRLGFDNNQYLIAFWRAIQRGWNPTTEVQMNKELYQKIKNNPDNFPPHIVALAGFCASYNAKWFGGYAGTVKTKINTYRNYYDEAVRNVLKQSEDILTVGFAVADYRDIHIKNCLFYCDPPYQGKTGYMDNFDHDQYWAWVREMSKDNIVLCSEYQAPPDFECIWTKELTTRLIKTAEARRLKNCLCINKKNKEKTQWNYKFIHPVKMVL